MRRKPSRMPTGRLQLLRLFSTLLAITAQNGLGLARLPDNTTWVVFVQPHFRNDAQRVPFTAYCQSGVQTFRHPEPSYEQSETNSVAPVFHFPILGIRV
jgi:hypothetical protein